jgi:aminoglycoside 6'-N-acetyltransferase I
MLIRKATEQDWEDWLRLRLLLWPDSVDDDESELREFIVKNGEKSLVLVAETSDHRVVGFVEAGIRDYADGCESRGVGYIEGWLVEEAWRRKGIGGKLVRGAEQWARGRGCTEMASDCLLDNDVSLAAHLRLGFREVERVIQFQKRL